MSDVRHGRCPGGAEWWRSVGLALGLMLGGMVVELAEAWVEYLFRLWFRQGFRVVTTTGIGVSTGLSFLGVE
jgi:hypothetical protein